MTRIDPEVFVDMITLLLHVNDNKTQELAQELITIVGDLQQYVDKEAGLIKFYIKLINQIISQRLTVHNPTELTMVLIKFKSDPTVQENIEVYNKLEELFIKENSISENTLSYISDKLHNQIIWSRCSKQIRKMFGYLNKCESLADPYDQRAYLDNILAASNDIQTVFNERNKDSKNLIEHIDFTDKNSLKASLEKYKDRKVANVMKFGLQGLNRMFGKNGGAALGESIVFNALGHNFKSGMLCSIPKWIVKYNDPPKNEDGKKSLILFISLENEAFENLIWWFKSIYEVITNSSMEGLSDDYIISYIHDYFNERGYTFIVERYLPSEFGYDDLVKVYSKYENSGYRIISTIIDYVNQMKKGSGSDANISKVGNHLLVRDLYNNMVNFMKSKGTLLCTAHQLNRDAQKLAGNTANAVKLFDSSHLSYSSDVHREVDVSINLHIEANLAHEKFLTMCCNKRRYDVLPEEHKYCAYKFGKYGIEDDIEGEDMSVSNIFSTKASISGKQSDVVELF